MNKKHLIHLVILIICFGGAYRLNKAAAESFSPLNPDNRTVELGWPRTHTTGTTKFGKVPPRCFCLPPIETVRKTDDKALLIDSAIQGMLAFVIAEAALYGFSRLLRRSTRKV